jgi:hypothetical protein
MAKLGEKVKAKAALNATCSSATLSSVAFSNIGLDQSAELALLVEPVDISISTRCSTRSHAMLPHLSVLASIDHASDVGDGDAW